MSNNGVQGGKKKNIMSIAVPTRRNMLRFEVTFVPDDDPQRCSSGLRFNREKSN